MERFEVTGGNPLSGTIGLSGAKNVALKVLAASLLTTEPMVILNVPDIADVRVMLECLSSLGVKSEFAESKVTLHPGNSGNTTIPLEFGARLRTSFLVMGPLLATRGEAHVPNPGGCRIGARPINRQIDALRAMGAAISYNPQDGYFHASAKRLIGQPVGFPKNTHTGTESVILASVLADGVTVIENAAREVEVDDLIRCLVSMGAKIKRTAPREITVEGVKKLHGTEFRIMNDRNEEVTFAILAAITGGRITVTGSEIGTLDSFVTPFTAAGAAVVRKGSFETEYSGGGRFLPVDVVTAPHPGFMTDWQAPWAVFMTQADGVSVIHETIFESRFSYVFELEKMGARIEKFQPAVTDPASFYNFNVLESGLATPQAIRIKGPAKLHNAVLEMQDLRAGATLLLAALVAPGTSVIYGIEQIDRGYERIEERLKTLGARVARLKKEGL